MWYLQAENTDTVAVNDVKVGDIVTLNTDPAHGYKVREVMNGRGAGHKLLKGGMGTWNVDGSKQVLRLNSVKNKAFHNK